MKAWRGCGAENAPRRGLGDFCKQCEARLASPTSPPMIIGAMLIGTGKSLVLLPQKRWAEMLKKSLLVHFVSRKALSNHSAISVSNFAVA